MAHAADVAAEPVTVIDGLKHIYNSRIKPVEELYRYSEFHSPLLGNSDFEAKPMVLLLGQYSVGKTSFIRYLLGRDFPGQRIGPEPTTDRFVAVMGGPIDRIIPGNALAVQADMPFRGLTKFGTAFLNKFEASVCNAEVLEKVYFVDTPGVLSGEKQRIGRSYDFVEVVEWFSERADMILLLFDAHKLDISDEFKRAINALKGQDDKVRVVLNKADRVTTQQLMRVYGALMWSLGKVVKTPEVVRVYLGSFWEKPLESEENRALFEVEQNDLLMDLRSLPRYAAVRKINELVKRARLGIVHAHIVSHLKAQMPAIFGKEKKQKELIDNLHKEFFKIHKATGLAVGDFPNLERMKENLSQADFTKFPKFNDKLIAAMNRVLAEDIPRLMRQLALSDKEKLASGLTETIMPGSSELDPSASDAGGAAGGAGGDSGAAWTGTPAEAREQLIKFYTRFNPAKLHAVDAILREYRGREGELFAALFKRYGNPDEEDPYSGAAGAPALHPAAAPRAAPAAAAVSATRAPPAPAASAPAHDNPFGDEDASADNPFGDEDDEWIVAAEKPAYDAMFAALAQTADGKVTGAAAKGPLLESGLAKAILRPLWELADIDKDGKLDQDEFAVAMYLVSMCTSGGSLPETLPNNMIPPSKR
uniref:Calmodulin n=1 Tax=Bicosoecida sp. CB-2014 TaxID=1486930 RepID=A0A7S1CI35_9STRA|mmetsp:Transcript_27672/g.95725  ORF Transcript_27672/g.95725 Transcript_27672/m.95725 type:complete len:648 (+) Transcript_27672:210-2153(+)